jgi:hypothetical protein
VGAITEAIYDTLAGDPTLTAMLATYGGEPAIFTTDPAPGDATLPYIVSAGEVAQTPWDTKTTRGWMAMRDLRCYTDATGSAVVVEAIAERARVLLHRQTLTIVGFVCVIADCSGPIGADGQDAYGRIVTVRLTIEEV